MHRQTGFLVVPFLIMFANLPALGQAPSPDRVQVGPPVRRIEPPSLTASAEELELRGDELRGEKAYADAMDYFRDALAKHTNSPSITNTKGIVDLQTLLLLYN